MSEQQTPEHKCSQSGFVSSIWLQESAILKPWSFPDSRKLAARAGLFQPDKSGSGKHKSAATDGPTYAARMSKQAAERSRSKAARFNTSTRSSHVLTSAWTVVCGL